MYELKGSAGRERRHENGKYSSISILIFIFTNHVVHTLWEYIKITHM